MACDLQQRSDAFMNCYIRIFTFTYYLIVVPVTSYYTGLTGSDSHQLECASVYARILLINYVNFLVIKKVVKNFYCPDGDHIHTRV